MANVTGKNLCWRLFLVKLQFWKPVTLLKKIPRLWHRCFPMKFANCLRTNFLKNTCERLLLNLIWKETPAQAFSCEFCKLFKNNYFVEDLQKAGSETPVWGSLFNKVASLMSRRPLTVSEIECSKIKLFILWNLLENVFVEHFLVTTSHMMLFFPFYRSVRFAA